MAKKGQSMLSGATHGGVAPKFRGPKRPPNPKPAAQIGPVTKPAAGVATKYT